MTLRARLIAAFFLLAVVPLCGITLFSYLTTEKAYRRAVEVETAALAEEMNGRLGSVTRDLGQRLERLRELPFGSLLPGKQQPEAIDKLLSDVRSQMGDAAPLVEALEFVPGAPPQTPPEPPGAIVIAPEAPQPAAGVASPPGPPRWVFRHRELAQKAAIGEAQRLEQDSAREQHRLERDSARAQAGAERDARLNKMREELTEKATHAAQLAMSTDTKDKQEGARIAGEAAALALRHIGEKIFRGKRDFLTQLGRGFDYAIRRDGADVGTVRAQVKPQQVLANVFSRTRRRQGEIPFAINEAGQLYADDRDRRRLQPLRLASIAKASTSGGVLKVHDDWVVVARRDADSGLTLGIARPVGQGLLELRGAALKNLSYGLGMAGLAVIGILPLSGRLTRDLRALTEGASKLAHGDLDARVEVRSKDDVGRLAEAFNRMATDLRANQERLLVQERLRKELEMGRRIQEEMLPRDRLRVPFAEAKGLSIPAREVGGDFFNYFALDGGEAALIVGDVSGKGVGAALMMANLQATLRARLPLEKDLVALARHMDVEIDQTTPLSVYLTAFIGVLEGNQRVMRYVNAGHNPPLVLRADGTVFALDSTGRPLGLLPGGDYEQKQVEFDEGDWLFLYTDGVTDSEDENGEPFGVERLQELLVAASGSGLDGVLARVEQAVREYRGGNEAADDATLVALRIGVNAA